MRTRVENRSALSSRIVRSVRGACLIIGIELPDGLPHASRSRNEISSKPDQQ